MRHLSQRGNSQRAGGTHKLMQAGFFVHIKLPVIVDTASTVVGLVTRRLGLVPPLCAPVPPHAQGSRIG
jgi:hypothetical protein